MIDDEPDFGPDIEGDCHPYCDWLPWETEMLEWLNANYHHRDEEGGRE